VVEADVVDVFRLQRELPVDGEIRPDLAFVRVVHPDCRLDERALMRDACTSM
jgi:hypothetical protein